MSGVCWDLSKIRCFCPNREEDMADGEGKREGVLARRSCRASREKHILGRDKNVHTENSRHVEETACETAQSLRGEADTARITWRAPCYGKRFGNTTQKIGDYEL